MCLRPSLSGCKNGIEAALFPLGFRATGRSLTWSREYGELKHLIGVHRKGDSYTIQWSIGNDAAAKLMWGEGDPRDISFNVMAGVPSSVSKPRLGNGWALGDVESEGQAVDIAAALKADLTDVAKWQERFRTRRDVWTYLLENRDYVDHRDFVFPAILPFKLAIAAALALSAGDRDGCLLMPDVRHALMGFRDKDSKQRLQRLEFEAGRICGEEPIP